MTTPGAGISRSLFASALLVVAVSVVVAWIGMSGPRLAKTEGHRAIPAWEMLETGEYYPTRMFGTIYVNKPPGLPWAIAASSAVFGENEFAARLPSALGHTLLALLALVFARSWFGHTGGHTGGLGGGLATALLPGFIAPARSADIESLLMVAAALVAFPMVSMLAPKDGWTKREPRLLALVVIVGMVCGALLKGPVLMLVVMGVWIGPLFLSFRGKQPRGSKWCLWAPLIGLALGVGVLYALYASIPDDETVVRQSFTGFMWSKEQLVGTALLAPGALALALPMSIALVFPFGRDACSEGEGAMGGRAVEVARIIAASVLAGLVVGMLYGLANPRYALPVLVMVGPLVGYVVAGSRGGFSPKRARIARTVLLGNGVVWVVVLMGAALWWAFTIRPEGRDKGYDAAVRIVEKLDHGGTVWAGQAVFSKPEVIWYMRELAAERGIELHCSWEREAFRRHGEPWSTGPHRSLGEMRYLVVPPKGVLTVLKMAEWERYEEAGMADRFERVVDVVPDSRGFVVARSLGSADVESTPSIDAQSP